MPTHWRCCGNTIECCQGAGFLGVPKAFYDVGMILGPALLGIVALACDITRAMLLEAMARAEAVTEVRPPRSVKEGAAPRPLVLMTWLPACWCMCQMQHRLTDAGVRLLGAPPLNGAHGIVPVATAATPLAVDTPTRDRTRASWRPRYRITTRKFEVTELCELFMGRKGKAAYVVQASAPHCGSPRLTLHHNHADTPHVCLCSTAASCGRLRLCLPLPAPPTSRFGSLMTGKRATKPLTRAGAARHSVFGWPCMLCSSSLCLLWSSRNSERSRCVLCACGCFKGCSDDSCRWGWPWVQIGMFLGRVIIILILVGTCLAAMQCTGTSFVDMSHTGVRHVPLFDIAGVPQMIAVSVYGLVVHQNIPLLAQTAYHRGKELQRTFQVSNVALCASYSLLGVLVAIYFGYQTESQCNLLWEGYVGCLHSDGAVTPEDAPAWAQVLRSFVLIFPALDVLTACVLVCACLDP